jgi:hypothetical protein
MFKGEGLGGVGLCNGEECLEEMEGGGWFNVLLWGAYFLNYVELGVIGVSKSVVHLLFLSSKTIQYVV